MSILVSCETDASEYRGEIGYTMRCSIYRPAGCQKESWKSYTMGHPMYYSTTCVLWDRFIIVWYSEDEIVCDIRCGTLRPACVRQMHRNIAIWRWQIQVCDMRCGILRPACCEKESSPSSRVTSCIERTGTGAFTSTTSDTIITHTNNARYEITYSPEKWWFREI